MRKFIRAATIGSLLVSGCNGSVTDGTSEPAIPENPPPLTSVAQIMPPLLDYSATFEEAATISNAEELLAARCAARFGVTYEPDHTATALTTSMDISPRYGPIDPAWVAIHGYTPQAPEFSEGTPWDPSPELLEVLYGEDANGNRAKQKDHDGNPVNEFGCFGEARQELFVDNPYFGDLERFIEQGLGYAQERMAVDSRVVKAENDWVACMATRGYSGDTYNAIVDENVTSEAPDGDLDFAMDDVACAQQVNLPGISYAVDSAYQERWLEEHGAELKTLHDGFEAGLERAKEVLSNR